LFEEDRAFKAAFTTTASVGKRSDVEFYLIARMFEAGFTEGETYDAMMVSPQTKWLERDDGYRKTTIRNAFTTARLTLNRRRERRRRDRRFSVRPLRRSQTIPVGSMSQRSLV